MKYLVLMTVLFLALASFSQQNDSAAKRVKSFEAFFGCDCCPGDEPIRKQLVDKNQAVYDLVLYRSVHLLEARKQGRVVWKKDLKGLVTETNWTELCIFDGKNDGNGRARILLSTGRSVAMLLYLENGKPVR